MNAIRVHEFGEPEVMKLETIDDPIPGPGEVVVAVKAIGVNPVETYIRSGKYAAKPVLPYTPGSDAAGVIEQIGSAVGHLKPGDRVYVDRSISGTYAEKVLCEYSHVHILPEHVTFVQGAALGTAYGAAYRGLLQRGHAMAGETVLVHGATGGVGTAALQLAREAGLTTIGSAGSDEGLEFVRKLGADHAIHHGDSKALRQISPSGVDLILEMLANVNLEKDLEMLAPHGRVVIIGSRGRIEIDPRTIMRGEHDVRGVMLSEATVEELRSMHSALEAALRLGTIQPIVSHELPLREAAKAHHMVMESTSFGKIVLLP